MYWLKIALFSILDNENETSNNYIIAKFILENYNQLSGVSLTEISRRCNLSKAAISRFCKDLGLIDYIDLQMLIRASHSKSCEEKPVLSLDEQKQVYLSHLKQITDHFPEIMADLAVEDLISDILQHQTIYTFGHLQASHIAYTLRNSLAVYGIFCYSAQSWVEQREKLKNAGKDDLVIIFSASGDFFKRLDINMSFIEKADAPKIYMVTFGRDNGAPSKIRKIYLGDTAEDPWSNVQMNMFINYISYRISMTY